MVVDVISSGAKDSITCLTGVSNQGTPLPFDVGGWNRRAVLNNDVVLGTVNANRRHYSAAAEALTAADQSWLSQLITRTVPIEEFASAFARSHDDVEVVLDVQAS